MIFSFFKQQKTRTARPAHPDRHGPRTYEIPEGLLATDRRLLLVENNLAFACLLKTHLSSCNFNVTLASNGKEGLHRILGSEYDVILCDMVMPGFPGDMFYRAVERIRPDLCQRFVFMTGHSGNPRIDAFIRSVRGLTLWKPFQLHELNGAIEVLFRKARSAVSIGDALTNCQPA